MGTKKGRACRASLEARARSAKVEAGFASDRAPLKIRAHDLFAKPPTLWRIMRRRQVALARGWSLDQIPQPRKGLKGPINRHFPAFVLRAVGGGSSPSRLSLRSSYAGHASPCRSGVAAPRVARQGEAWRPGLDLNQDKERCTVLASTHSATGPRRPSPILPKGATVSLG